MMAGVRPPAPQPASRDRKQSRSPIPQSSGYVPGSFDFGSETSEHMYGRRGKSSSESTLYVDRDTSAVHSRESRAEEIQLRMMEMMQSLIEERKQEHRSRRYLLSYDENDISLGLPLDKALTRISGPHDTKQSSQDETSGLLKSDLCHDYVLSVDVDPINNKKKIGKEARLILTGVEVYPASRSANATKVVLFNDTCSSINVVGQALLNKRPDLISKMRKSDEKLRVGGVHGVEDTEANKLNLRLRLDPEGLSDWIEIECYVLPAFKGEILVSAPQLRKWGTIINMSGRQTMIEYKNLQLAVEALSSNQRAEIEVLTVHRVTSQRIDPEFCK